MVTAAVRGDAGTVKALLRAVDDDDLAAVVHTTLMLARALAGQLLTTARHDGRRPVVGRNRPRASHAPKPGSAPSWCWPTAQTVGEFDEMVVIGIGAYNAVLRRGR